MKDLELHLDIVRRSFPIHIEPENTELNLFEGGYLYRRKNRNQYCFIDKKGRLFFHLFNSSSKETIEIEQDFLASDLVFISNQIVITDTIISSLV